MIKVFHMKDSARKANPSSWLKAPEEFNMVDYGTVIAYVDTDSLEDCFTLTNHIDHDWSMNPEVTMQVERSVRSSSVGDLFEVIGDGLYVVDNCGFKKVGSH